MNELRKAKEEAMGCFCRSEVWVIVWSGRVDSLELQFLKN
jgi:hypothetical protein